ncbi:DNA-directed RNA polymerase subunit B [Candidatus Woesearchaeota archaeon CG_4_10_14_0_2_um_filter_33_10]|nr:MAG: DNA-directed RNA polymerase subunit B [Candidatus Woesearchaeota archaeon CG1_02_33_12]PIU72383.1 MAG: DNA-directed RNA polymerase subunit B [Candidatus Woesearchaeota archaeon CG06_land_8_20_14_3_00_33_13]PIZ54100.1 MAG: DNA-directed RNA polymerase subunit B [Candidatus Woesearchaeota archaeon CG_4_10_14_0_2_um_filter_33_10]
MNELYLNGKFIGKVENPSEFTEKVREARRNGVIPDNLNIYYDKRVEDIQINDNKGRLRRPLIVVKDGQPTLTEDNIKKLQKNEILFSDLIKQGVIEYLDAAEEENAFIAFSREELTKEHTHLEITPLAMVGLCTSLVPYANFSPGARISIGSKNQKQALGMYAINFPIRIDMDVNILHYPQIPLVQSIMHEVSNYNKHPSGQNMVVAVMSYKGYNVDDAVILNKASIDRGLGRSTYYRPTIAEELRYSSGLTDEISIPDKDIKGYKSERDYRLLEGDGIIFPEANVIEGDVIIGKTSPPRFLSSMDQYNLAPSSRRESSVALKHGEEGVIDFVLITESSEGNRLVQVKIRDQRIPELGDKFTSRHGQKGVVGLIVDQADMPFTASGITPDLLFSPHGIPSRMTISHLIELIAGKTGALSSRYIDGTLFDVEPEKKLRRELLSLGFRENGVETMYNGITGEQLEAKIYIGNIYYMKLKHMVANKIHARARGPIQLLTRQPTEGRAKEGGLRLGEMEKDTFVAHGASLLLKERFDADGTVIPICESCGMVAVHDKFRNKLYCPICGDNVEINFIEISYAFKLLLDELKSLTVHPKLILKNKY